MATNFNDGFPNDPSQAIQASTFLTPQEQQEWFSWLNTASPEDKDELVTTLHELWKEAKNVPNAAPTTPAASYTTTQTTTTYSTPVQPVTPSQPAPAQATPMPAPAANPFSAPPSQPLDTSVPEAVKPPTLETQDFNPQKSSSPDGNLAPQPEPVKNDYEETKPEPVQHIPPRNAPPREESQNSPNLDSNSQNNSQNQRDNRNNDRRNNGNNMNQNGGNKQNNSQNTGRDGQNLQNGGNRDTRNNDKRNGGNSQNNSFNNSQNQRRDNSQNQNNESKPNNQNPTQNNSYKPGESSTSQNSKFVDLRELRSTKTKSVLDDIYKEYTKQKEDQDKVIRKVMDTVLSQEELLNYVDEIAARMISLNDSWVEFTKKEQRFKEDVYNKLDDITARLDETQTQIDSINVNADKTTREMRVFKSNMQKELSELKVNYAAAAADMYRGTDGMLEKLSWIQKEVEKLKGSPLSSVQGRFDYLREQNKGQHNQQ